MNAACTRKWPHSCSEMLETPTAPGARNLQLAIPSTYTQRACIPQMLRLCPSDQADYCCLAWRWPGVASSAAASTIARAIQCGNAVLDRLQFQYITQQNEKQHPEALQQSASCLWRRETAAGRSILQDEDAAINIECLHGGFSSNWAAERLSHNLGQCTWGEGRELCRCSVLDAKVPRKHSCASSTDIC